MIEISRNFLALFIHAFDLRIFPTVKFCIICWENEIWENEIWQLKSGLVWPATPCPCVVDMRLCTSKYRAT